MANVNRRQALKKAMGLGAALVSGTTGAEAQERQATEMLTTADTRVADKIAGREPEYADEKERAQMLGVLTRMRDNLRTLRTSPLAFGQEPAVHFSPLLPGERVPTGKGEVNLSRGKMPEYNGDVETLAFATVGELSRLLKARKVTSLELTQMYLRRLKKFGPRLLCVVNLCEERALAEAKQADAEIKAGHYRGVLHGVPYGVKDLFAAKGYPTTFGAKPYEHQDWDFDSTVVHRLNTAGAVLLAKLSMGELAMGDVWFGGVTRNPWNPKLGSSGSSAGPGSATAAGLVGFAVGTETLGSIISPSCVNGTAGLRPTYGRVSRYGAMALSWTMDKIGPMCRSVEDCALVFGALLGADGEDVTLTEAPFTWKPGSNLPKWRVGIDKVIFDAVAKQSEAMAKVYRDALTVLEKAGIALVPITLPQSNPAYSALAGLIIDVEGAASFAELTMSGKSRELVQQSPRDWATTFRLGMQIPATEYLQAMRVRTHLQQKMAAAMEGFDAYVTVPRYGSSLVYTNLCGYPEAITRCGKTTDGLPLMLSFVAKPYQDEVALRLAWLFEQATAFQREWPDTEKLPEVPPAMG